MERVEGKRSRVELCGSFKPIYVFWYRQKCIVVVHCSPTLINRSMFVLTYIVVLSSKKCWKLVVWDDRILKWLSIGMHCVGNVLLLGWRMCSWLQLLLCEGCLCDVDSLPYRVTTESNMSRTICTRGSECSEDINMCSSERINCTKHLTTTTTTLIALVLNNLIIAFLTRRTSRSTTVHWTCPDFLN